MNNNNKTHNNNKQQQAPPNITTRAKTIPTTVDVKHSQQYNQLLNLRSTLLHMQYLYCHLDESLQNQYKNQQSQHKDHLVQCYNMKEQFQQIKKDNFNKLFIIKLEEFLALEEEVNEKLNRQSLTNQKINYSSATNNNIQKYPTNHQQSSLSTQQYEFLPSLDRFLTFITIKQSQMQQSLCKLYIGNKTLVDLEKTSQKIQQIQQKINFFTEKHRQLIEKYNRNVAELEETIKGFKGHMEIVEREIDMVEDEDQTKGKQYEGLQENSRKVNNDNLMKKRKYQRHIKGKLLEKEEHLQRVLEVKKKALLIF